MTGFKCILTIILLVMLAFIALGDMKSRKISHVSCSVLLLYTLIVQVIFLLGGSFPVLPGVEAAGFTDIAHWVREDLPGVEAAGFSDIAPWVCEGLPGTFLSFVFQKPAGKLFWLLFITLLRKAFIALLPCLLIEGLNGALTGFSAIGGGDIRLIYVGCLLVGSERMWEMLLLACMLFLLQALILHRRRLPFGPAICTAVFLCFLTVL